jgi:hypothetical protein
MKSIEKINQLAPAWFKENCSGLKAKKILKKYKDHNGAFLVRTLVKKSYWSKRQQTIILLSIMINRKMKNYEIKSSGDKFYFDAKYEMRKFDSIIQLIDFHYRTAKDLPIKLEGPALKINKFDMNQFHLSLYSQIYESNSYYDMLKLYQKGVYQELTVIEEVQLEDFFKSLPKERKEIYQKVGDYSVIYEIQQSDLLNSDCLRLDRLIEKGNFGEVHFGTYMYKNTKNENKELPVAIKRLHLNDEKAKKEIKKEAALMKSLIDSPHIIKYLGLCFNTINNSEFLNIVLEFAKLGSLYTYLRKNQDFSFIKIATILYQISSAMEYLASKKIVHRDLASRNVLLVNENSAKVSDFGLSRLANSDGEYMADLREKQWPFRWFSPELMENGKFKKIK